MADTPVIDPAVIENLRTLNTDGTDDFLREIVGLFLADIPVHIAELERNLASGDTLTFTRAAHSIKGSAANLGAKPLQSAAEKLEVRSRGAARDGLTSLLGELRVEFARAQSALEQILAKSGRGA